MKNILTLILFLSFSTSCVTTSPQKLNPAVYYKNDICFSYKKQGHEEEAYTRTFSRNGEDLTRKRRETKKHIKFCGVGTLPYSKSYEIKIESFYKMDVFTMTTCHREVLTTEPDKGLFKKDGEVEINYTPTLEKGRACPLFISVYNKKGKHAWGMIAFEHPRFALMATLRCNGDEYLSPGVSACESRAGLIQEINFIEEVKITRAVNGSADRAKPCPDITSKDNKKFIFTTPPRECIYGFIGKTSGMVHQLFTIGYEEFIVRD